MFFLKNVLKNLKAFRKSPKKYIITVILGAILIALLLYSFQQRNRQGIAYSSILEETAISVDGHSRSFREVAFYVAYEEQLVHEQALVYNSEKPQKYWNAHVNGVFLRIAARNSVIQMAIHDELFYQMALEAGVELNEAERESLQSSQEDAWNDLAEYDKQDLLGVTREDIDACLERMIYAQKYQLFYANLQNLSYEDYNWDEEAYEKLLEEHSFEKNEEAWKALQFGKITLVYE